MPLRAIAFIAIMAIAVPATLAYPFVGILTWNWLAYMNPHQQTWGAMAGVRVALIVAIATLAAVVLSGRERLRAIGGREIGLVVAFLVTLIVSYASAYDRGLAYGKLVQYAKIFLMCYVMICLVKTERRFRILTWTTALFVCAIGIKGVLVGPVRGFPRIYGPPGSFLEDNNDYALALNMMVPFFWILGVTETARRLKSFWYACLVLTVVAALFTYSRGGFIGLGLTVGLMAWRSRHKALAVGVLTLGLAIGIPNMPERLREQIGTLERPTQVGSAQDRFRAWAVARNMARHHPFTGVGLRNFTLVYDQFSTMGGDYRKVAHSAYFHILGEAGYISLTIFVLIILASLFTLRKLRRQLRRVISEREAPRGPPARAALRRERRSADDAANRDAPAEAGDEGQENGGASLQRLARYVTMCEVSIISYAITASFLSRADFDLYFQIIAMTVMLRELTRTALAPAGEGEPVAAHAPVRNPAPAMGG